MPWDTYLIPRNFIIIILIIILKKIWIQVKVEQGGLV